VAKGRSGKRLGRILQEKHYWRPISVGMQKGEESKEVAIVIWGIEKGGIRNGKVEGGE